MHHEPHTSRVIPQPQPATHHEREHPVVFHRVHVAQHQHMPRMLHHQRQVLPQQAERRIRAHHIRLGGEPQTLHTVERPVAMQPCMHPTGSIPLPCVPAGVRGEQGMRGRVEPRQTQPGQPQLRVMHGEPLGEHALRPIAIAIHPCATQPIHVPGQFPVHDRPCGVPLVRALPTPGTQHIRIDHTSRLCGPPR